jgi:threonine dehydratase
MPILDLTPDPLPTLEDVLAAESRLRPYIRHTPLMLTTPTKNKLLPESSVYLKLELMQITGSFKARGAMHKLLTTPAEQIARGIVTASGGNHGLGVAYAGWVSGRPATIYLGANTPPAKADKLQQWGAEVVWAGEVWDDANAAALQRAEQDGMAYFHPFADPAVIAGQGTIMLEVMERLPQVDVMVAAIGGGGLIGGISIAAKALNPRIRIIGVEPIGAPTLYESVRVGHPVTLEAIRTEANTLAPRQSSALNLKIIQQHVEEIILVSDEAMYEAARWLWYEFALAAEFSGAAALAGLMSGQVRIQPGETVCVLVCGAGTDGIPAV